MAKKIKKDNTFTYGRNNVIINKNEEVLSKDSFTNASIKLRFFAFLVDCLIFMPLMYIMLGVAYSLRLKGLAGDSNALMDSNYLGLSIICLALVLFGFFPDRFNGQTIGKKIFKIRVVDYNGQQLGIIRSFLREFVFRIAIGIMLIPGTIIYSLILSKKLNKFTFELVHDYICGTRVVLKS